MKKHLHCVSEYITFTVHLTTWLHGYMATWLHGGVTRCSLRKTGPVDVDVVALLLCHELVVHNVVAFPRIRNPAVWRLPGSNVVALLGNAIGQLCTLLLELVVQHKHVEVRLELTVRLLLGVLDQLVDRIVDRCAGVVHLVDDKHLLAHQVNVAVHVVDPLDPLHPRADLLGRVASRLDVLVEREDDGKDPLRRLAGLLQERPQDPCRNEPASANGNDEVDVQLHDFRSNLLAELVDVVVRYVDLIFRHRGSVDGLRRIIPTPDLPPSPMAPVFLTLHLGGVVSSRFFRLLIYPSTDLQPVSGPLFFSLVPFPFSSQRRDGAPNRPP